MIKNKIKNGGAIALAILMIGTYMPVEASAMELTSTTQVITLEQAKAMSDIPEGTEIIFEDKDVRDILKAQGYKIDESIFNSSRTRTKRSVSNRNGVNKIKKVSGGYDIYLSKNTCKLIQNVGAGAAGYVLNLVPFVGAAAGIVGASLVSLPDINSGKIFRIRTRRVPKWPGSKIYTIQNYVHSIGNQ